MRDDWVNITFADEHGSGVQFDGRVKASEVIAYTAVAEDTIPGVKTIILLRGRDQGVPVGLNLKELDALLGNANES